MKTYNAETRISKQLKIRIQDTINMHKKYKSSYHWRPGQCASARRSSEKIFESLFTPFAIKTKDGLLTVDASYSVSCNHCYYSMTIDLDGDKKNISALKKLIK